MDFLNIQGSRGTFENDCSAHASWRIRNVRVAIPATRTSGVHDPVRSPLCLACPPPSRASRHLATSALLESYTGPRIAFPGHDLPWGTWQVPAFCLLESRLLCPTCPSAQGPVLWRTILCPAGSVLPSPPERGSPAIRATQAPCLSSLSTCNNPWITVKAGVGVPRLHSQIEDVENRASPNPANPLHLWTHSRNGGPPRTGLSTGYSPASSQSPQNLQLTPPESVL